ncbi:PIG-L deacetylase family protein [Amycolatopsis regifaucium]|uniref:LmbE family protein n=1 Tax=Amycolatopsis regifaucium TaxID=546365 RepID=A0A154M6K6_9PSEU|nr:PIG-L family deacetylase [Amycolatopsis regifaucium]KZB80245.1 LmbE family protein [Amycolatopsis regifaucium]OKA09662.1 PIG-L family deacetylase [Amycolatopsis regifaucium]SFH61167.1 N-acetylglucosaminyl deacetylase, LmbE family [Amycolatopsis regifaucium]
MTHDLGADRLLAISPHLDDAVLSFGAGLAQAERDGAKVTVHTVFAGSATPPFSPAAERLHSIWGLSPDQDASLRRREEDIAALGHLGAEYRHSRFLDAIYRKSPDGRWLADNVPGRQKLAIGPQSPQGDPELFAAVKAEIASIVGECDPTLIVTCAAASGHVDNEITRDATLLVAREKDIPVRLWEDLPHAMFAPGAAELPAGFGLGVPDFVSVEPAARTRKFEAMRLYPTQMSMLHGPEKDLFAQLEGHARKSSPQGAYGETTWPVIAREDNG